MPTGDPPPRPYNEYVEGVYTDVFSTAVGEAMFGSGPIPYSALYVWRRYGQEFALMRETVDLYEGSPISAHIFHDTEPEDL